MNISNKFNRKIVATIILFIISTNNVDVHAKQIQNHYSREERNSLFLKALSVVPEHKVPAELRFLLHDSPPAKCATMILQEIRQNFEMFSYEQKAILNEALQRPNPKRPAICKRLLY